MPSIEEPAALRALIDRVRAAADSGTPLCLRGAGSKDFYGETAAGEPLSMLDFRGIVSHQPTELVVTARCGTPLAELEAALAEAGQCLPFEPPHFGADVGASSGTVGGMVAAGLAGPARMAVGSVRDHVLGATLINGRGELLGFGGTVIKNVAGYDVSRLLTGSMGILGVIAEVSLKVLPMAPAVATLRFALDQGQTLQHLNTWAGQPLPVQASAWVDDMLTVRLAGARAAVAQAVQRLGGEPVDAVAAAAFWRSVRDQRHAFFTHAGLAVAGGSTLWRLALPPTAPVLPLPGPPFIEWGGALRWWCGNVPADSVRATAAAAGGHATIFAGNDKSAGVLTALSPPLARIHQALKTAFDPFGIFNPGRLYPGL